MKKLITAVALLAVALVCGAWSFGNVRIGQFRKAIPYSGIVYTTNTWTTNQTLGDVANSHNGRIGCMLVPRENIYVTAIGRWKINGNSQVHQLNIVDIENTNIVASGSVDLSSGDAGFVYFTLTNECILYAGRSYALWSYETSGGDYWYDSATVLENTDVAYSSNALYGLAGAYEPYGFVGGSNHCYGPVNFKYANVSIAPWKNPSLVLFAEAQSVAGSAGASVTSLPDQSPNNVAINDENNGHQFILTNNIAELNGKKWMIDNGTNRLRVFAPTVVQPYSVFVVMRDNEADTRNAFVLEGLSQIVQNVIGATWVYCGQSSYVTQVPQATWTLVEIKFNGASSEFWTNGVNSGTFNPGTADLANFKLGARWNTDEAGIYGGYAALSIYGNLSDDSRALIRNYYRTNYALPIPVTNSFIASTPSGTTRNDFYGWVGGVFKTPSYGLVVNGLGRWVLSGNSQAHTIKLRKVSDYSLVATATCNTSGASAGWLKVPIDEVTLSGNTEYVIYSEEGGIDLWYDTQAYTTSIGLLKNAAHDEDDNEVKNDSAGQMFGPVNFWYRIP